MVVRPVSPADTADLRRQVLRGGRPVPLPGDDEPAFHLGAYDGQVLLGTGNVRQDPAPWIAESPAWRLDTSAPAWRLRGMATAEGRRSEGVGAAVLAGLVAHVRAQGGAVVWCHARTPAQRFYERAGFVPHGDSWDDPEIGPHVRMWLRI